MKIVIPGGTGQVGTLLASTFHGEGHDVVALSRQPQPAPWKVVAWDAATLGAWAAELEDADAVINLAGRSINCRYTPANRRAIIGSRVDSVRAVGKAVAQAAQPPRVWLQAGTATIYAHRYDAPNDEATGLMASDHEPNAPETWRFANGVATVWEGAFAEFKPPHTRQVMLRTTMVMSPSRGGVFDVMVGLARRGLGGRMGDGRQYIAWIHGDDFARAILWLIERDGFSGPVNLAAPHPLPNAEFMADLRAAAGIRFGLPAAAWMLEIGAWLMRTETELILKSRNVIPGRLVAGGFKFNFPTWPEAAVDLYRKWRSAQG
jgi:uncharacterized protein (TIGR01777 family)